MKLAGADAGSSLVTTCKNSLRFSFASLAETRHYQFWKLRFAAICCPPSGPALP